MTKTELVEQMAKDAGISKSAASASLTLWLRMSPRRSRKKTGR